jgi:ribonuclease HII
MHGCVHEEQIWERGIRWLAGVDEAGRGPLAGPVVAAAVVFPRGVRVEGVMDSKLLSERRRDLLYERISRSARSIGVGVVDHTEIDRLNILNATFKAMHAAIAALHEPPQHLLIDGNLFRTEVDRGASCCSIPFTTLVDGDAKSFLVAAASIIAKVTRDRLMRDYDREYPGYGFGEHKGYATLRHREALRALGPSPIHRRSFTLCRQRPSSRQQGKHAGGPPEE